jgi:hypothetical protein
MEKGPESQQQIQLKNPSPSEKEGNGRRRVPPGSDGDLLSVQLRYEPYTGKNCAPDFIMGNGNSERLCDDTLEFFFTDQFRESLYPPAKGPDPFTPQQHALDVVETVPLHMVRQEIIEYMKFVDLVSADINAGQTELLVKLVRHFLVCGLHEVWGNTVFGTHGSARGEGYLFPLKRPGCDNGSCAHCG